MKKLFAFILICGACLGCDSLGIGKQCYTCTTISYLPSLQKIGEKDTEVCGRSDMEKFKTENTGNKGTVILQTNCTSK